MLTNACLSIHTAVCGVIPCTLQVCSRAPFSVGAFLSRAAASQARWHLLCLQINRAAGRLGEASGLSTCRLPIQGTQNPQLLACHGGVSPSFACALECAVRKKTSCGQRSNPCNKKGHSRSKMSSARHDRDGSRRTSIPRLTRRLRREATATRLRKR